VSPAGWLGERIGRAPGQSAGKRTESSTSQMAKMDVPPTASSRETSDSCWQTGSFRSSASTGPWSAAPDVGSTGGLTGEGIGTDF